MAGKNKTYELMLKIGGKVDGSLKTACSTADKNLAALGKTAKTAGKIAAGAMVAAATAVATLGTAAVKSAAEYEAQLANVSTLLTGTEAEVAARTAEIGDQVLEISNRTGVATADLECIRWFLLSVTEQTPRPFWKPRQNPRRRETRPRRTVSTYFLP